MNNKLSTHQNANIEIRIVSSSIGQLLVWAWSNTTAFRILRFLSIFIDNLIKKRNFKMQLRNKRPNLRHNDIKGHNWSSSYSIALSFFSTFGVSCTLRTACSAITNQYR